MENKKDDLDTNSDHSDSTLSIPSGSDSNRSDSPETVVGNSNIDEDIMKKNDNQINFKHPGSGSNALVKQQKESQMELDNMKPAVMGGETPQKDGEYEEYFMSVNQHKKSLRGEKLVVSKTEESRGGCQTVCCWLLAMLLLAGAIAVAVLIGTGVIDTNPTRHVKEGRRINSQPDGNELTAPRLLEVNHANAPNILTNNPKFFQAVPLKPENDFPPRNSVVNVFTGQMKISNMEWDENLNTNTSEIFQTLARKIESDLKSLFVSVASDNNSQVMVKVNEFVPGSVIVKYTVGWLADNEVLKASNVRAAIIKQLKNENGKLFGKFVVDKDSVTINYVLDECEKHECSYECQYYFTELRFVCLCPDNNNNGRLAECEHHNWREAHAKPGDQRFPEPSTHDLFKTDGAADPETEQLESVSKPEDSSETKHEKIVIDDTNIDVDESNEPEITSNEKNQFDTTSANSEAVAEPEPESKPEPVIAFDGNSYAQTEKDDESELEPEPEADFKLKSEPEPEPEIDQESKAEPEPEYDNEPKSEPEPENNQEPKSEEEHENDHQLKSELGPYHEVPKSEPELKFEEPDIEPEPNHDEPISDPEPNHQEPKSEPEPNYQEPKSEPEPDNHQELKSKPVANSHEPTSESNPENDKDPESELGPENDNEPTIELVHVHDQESEAENYQESTSEPEPETYQEPTSEPEPENYQESTSIPEPETGEPEPVNDVEDEFVQAQDHKILSESKHPENKEDSTTEDSAGLDAEDYDQPQNNQDIIFPEGHLDNSETGITNNPTTTIVPTGITQTSQKVKDSEDIEATTIKSSEKIPSVTGKQTPYENSSPVSFTSESDSELTSISESIEISTDNKETKQNSLDNNDTKKEVGPSAIFNDAETERYIEATTISNSGELQKNTEDDESAQHESIPVDLDTDDDYNDNLSNEGNKGSTEQTSDDNMDAKQVTKLNNLIIETENMPEVSTKNKHLDKNTDVKITTVSDIVSGSFLQINATSTSPSAEASLSDINNEEESSSTTTESIATTINTGDAEIEELSLNMDHSFAADVGVPDTGLEQIENTIDDATTEQPTDTIVGVDEINNTNRSSNSRAVDSNKPSANVIPTESPSAEDITKIYEITFSAKGNEGTKEEDNTKKVLVNPSIEEFNKTAVFLEEDPACLSGVVCGGNCLARHQVCDSLFDCENKIDEAECSFPTCNPDEFPCLSGRCIPAGWKCDGKPDCSTGEDEVACTASCQPGEFLCREGKCIPELHICDGTADCGQGDDEANCKCGSDEEKCAHGGGCVMRSRICDGRYDCPDRSDELQCLKLNGTTLEIRTTPDKWSPICSDNWDNSWSDLACRQLGYSGQLNTAATYDYNLTDEDFWYRNSSVSASPQPVQKAGVISGSNTCPSKEKVDVFCQNFECGRWNLSENVANVLVGGVNDLESGSRWPSVAVLFNVKRKASCTVSIFSPKWLITSHSCVQSKSLNPLEWVVFGGPSGYNPTASESAQIKIVKNIVSHPNAKYGQHLVTNDIALIEVHDALKLNTLVNAICLARNQIEDRQLCVTAGWTSSSEGISFNQYLTYLPVPTVPLSECNSTAKYNGHLTNSMFCSKSNGDSRVCHTDEGSPLMCLSETGVWELHGVLSKHGQCGTERPAVFTGIHAVRGWVESTVGSAFD